MQLLISVVAAEEVSAALQGGADIVDVKNPAEGALGASLPHIIRRATCPTCPERLPWQPLVLLAAGSNSSRSD
jgi:uncharacterized protein (UPF0264 family)